MTLPPDVRVAWREVPPGAVRREVSRSLLAELLPGADVVSRCSACGGEHGRVRVTGVEATASVSYAEGWAVVATSRSAGSVGVDAVPAEATGLDNVLPGADARTWARVEAVLKADGRGLTVDPARVRIEPRADDTWVGRVDDGAPYDGYDVVGPSDVVVAVAVSPVACAAR